ncbi:Lpg1974 family pore-forming outer membrane protein [Legionella yabuuchiae]|uniref:Lpg1974 family pore-forming outer membrane protein n=1 Tax=Legionella yabuuchiae TaxID=376727 RepID=UPI00105422DA|nr:Lpg1974 family pore-forming outer membrane protein [Legionella yabuuchiae]
MFSFKKTLLTTLILSNCVSYAGTMGPVCQPGDVTVPCERTAWDIGIQALYLRTTYSDNLSWSGSNTTNIGNVETSRSVENAPDWTWGFKLEGSYHFNTGNDINLNWYHLDKKTATHTLSDLTQREEDEVIINERDVQTVSFSPRWDAVNLEFGQHVDLGVFKNVRLHGGVQYGHIKTELTTFERNSNGERTTTQLEQTYDGFGPRIGSDLFYNLNSHFAVYAKGATALLIGKADFSSSSANIQPAPEPDLDPTESFTFSSGSKTALVPELEAKLGLQYNVALTQGELTLDLGYMWVNYFQVLATLEGSDTYSDSNFGLHGPYFGLKWVGSIA